MTTNAKKMLLDAGYPQKFLDIVEVFREFNFMTGIYAEYSRHNCGIILRLLQPMTVYKKAYVYPRNKAYVYPRNKAYVYPRNKALVIARRAVIDLLLPTDTYIRVNIYNPHEKCRASRARCTSPGAYSSFWMNSFMYRRGCLSVPNYFDINSPSQCSGGIHFFFFKRDAQRYSFS